MTSISLAEYHAQYAPKTKPKSGRSKYNAQRIEKNGMKFDSVKEYKRYIELTARMQRGEISELQCQVKFVLAPKIKLEGEKRAKPELMGDVQAFTDPVGALKAPKEDERRITTCPPELMAQMKGINKNSNAGRA